MIQSWVEEAHYEEHAVGEGASEGARDTTRRHAGIRHLLLDDDNGDASTPAPPRQDDPGPDSFLVPPVAEK